MGIICKTNFPYHPKRASGQIPPSEQLVIFFGTNFYDLPPGWTLETFIEKTNQMLDYIRQNFSGFKLLYQPHPSETTEDKALKLDGFTVCEHTVAELFLYENADKIAYTFSACSGASASAFSMGIPAAVFLETLWGIIPKWDILAYRSYFAGLPDSFFIKSFTDPVPVMPELSAWSEDLFTELKKIIGEPKTVWLLGPEPSVMIKANLLAQNLRRLMPGVKINLIKLQSRRWDFVESQPDFFKHFDQIVSLTEPSVKYSARPWKMRSTYKAAQAIKKMPLKPGDAFITFPHTLFEENCFVSYFPQVKKVLAVDNRWYDFTYGDGSSMFVEKDFYRSKGVIFFNYVVEPLLGLYRTVFLEYPGCSVLNRLRYTAPLKKVYDATFVFMPAPHQTEQL